MNAFRRRLLQTAVALSAVLATAIASADVGTITLSTGEVISGEIQQIVKGEYVIVQLPSGQVKAIAWAQIGQLAVGGSITVGGGTVPPATTPPPPPPTYTPPPPTYVPPPTVYAPPPPPPAYGPPPPMLPPPRPAFQPAFMMGARIGQITPGGNLVGDSGSSSNVEMSQYATPGWSFEGDVGLHFSPSWTLYGFWEYGQLGRADAAKQPERPTTNAVGMGLNANTSPHGPIGFVVDVALGYRWLALSQTTMQSNGAGGFTTGTERFVLSGIMPIRVGAGIAIVATSKVRIDLMAQFAAGTFSQQTGGAACANGCEIETSRQGSHYFTGLTAGARWDL